MESSDIVRHHDSDPDETPWVHGKQAEEVIEVADRRLFIR